MTATTTTNLPPPLEDDDLEGYAAAQMAERVAPVREAIRKAVDLLVVEPGQVVEIRTFNVAANNYRGFVKTVSGCFDNLDLLADAAAALDARKHGGIYWTINPAHDGCLCWADNELVEEPEHTVGDRDVLRIAWIPIDVDSVRPSECSATDAEIEAARVTAGQVKRHLREANGWEPAIEAFSGNGWHMLYRADLPNDPDGEAYVKQVVNDLADVHSDKRVIVDRKVVNPGRILKVWGTMARKGYEVPRKGRIHRRSRLCEKGEI